MATIDRTPPSGPTGIDFVIRSEDYPWTRKLVDQWAGFRDGARLAPHQQHRKTPSTGPGPSGTRTQILTPWANAVLQQLRREQEYEELIGATMADPVSIELATILASIPAATAEAATAEETHTRTTQDGPASSVPVNAGETYETAEVIASRRADEHAAALAKARARADAANTRTRELQARVPELQQILDNIRHTVDHRHARAEALTRIRLGTYARGIARRHPDAPVIADLTEHLTLPPRPHSKTPHPGTGTPETN